MITSRLVVCDAVVDVVLARVVYALPHLSVSPAKLSEHTTEACINLPRPQFIVKPLLHSPPYSLATRSRTVPGACYIDPASTRRRPSFI